MASEGQGALTVAATMLLMSVFRSQFTITKVTELKATLLGTFVVLFLETEEPRLAPSCPQPSFLSQHYADYFPPLLK